LLREAAVAGVRTVITGGVGPLIQFGVNQGINAAIPLLPEEVLAPLAEASTRVNDFVGAQGGGMLLGVEADSVGGRDRSGVAWAATTVLGVSLTAVAGRISNFLRRACFAAGTLVHTRDGLKPIDQVRVGDSVWSRSEHDVGEPGWRKVIEHACTGEQEIFEVSVSTPSGRSETYRTTELHPFWIETGGEGRGGFIAAGDLKIGEQLRLADGSAAHVTNISATGVIEPVYNFSVEGWRTYHVGELGTWVHNECVDVSRIRPERGLTGSRKHGLGWTAQDAIARARRDNTPQGKFGSQADLDFVTGTVRSWATDGRVRTGIRDPIALPEGHSSRVYFPDGSSRAATHVWIRINSSGTYHAYPMILD